MVRRGTQAGLKAEVAHSRWVSKPLLLLIRNDIDKV